MNLQPDTSILFPFWHAALVLGPALACAAAACFAGRGASASSAWRVARAGAMAALVLAAASLVAVLLGSRGAAHGLRADAIGAVVMLLVTFVGWVIVRYSQPYLNGEQRERQGMRWLMATLATVALVVATNHLLVLALAWMATSLTLHRLLTFFGERPAAVMAAHKKFIIGRLADVCLLAACGLLFGAFGTLHIDEILSKAASVPQLTWEVRWAVLLVVCAALLKCAQLPFHGWLIQVMEAPTPVSALLHAGVVNLGGFVLMRLAPLVGEVPAAQALLVVAGTATAVLAAAVMSTRISVKVMLAWSTCAQMGFMLMQCGLGAWEMALLHLVAHSLYKAHAFLGAGGVVRRTQLARMTPASSAPRAAGLALGVLAGAAMTGLAAVAVGMMAPGHDLPPTMVVLAGIVALALAPLLQSRSLQLGWLWLPALGAGAFAAAFAYFVLHALLSSWLATPSAPPAGALWMGVAVAFAALFVLQSLIAVAPQNAWVRRLYPWFYGGLFLDEAFSRLAFAVWPPPRPIQVAATLPATEVNTVPQLGLPATHPAAHHATQPATGASA